MFESLLRQGMIGSSLLSHGFNPNLFVAIVVAGMIGIIFLFVFCMSRS